jgi:catechol 2,3-dioxygenase-like lactoylglutathione lyase family enzyme
MNIKESNVTINVKDLDRSISFYESIGFVLKNRWDDHYAQLTAPNIEIGLHPTSQNNLKDNSGNISIGLTVTDFQDVKSQLLKLSIATTDRQEEGG